MVAMFTPPDDQTWAAARRVADAVLEQFPRADAVFHEGITGPQVFVELRSPNLDQDAIWVTVSSGGAYQVEVNYLLEIEDDREQAWDETVKGAVSAVQYMATSSQRGYAPWPTD
jgi:hypothetical protein